MRVLSGFLWCVVLAASGSALGQTTDAVGDQRHLSAQEWREDLRFLAGTNATAT